MIFKIGIYVNYWPGQLSGTYPHLAEAPPHVHSALLLSILLIGLLLILIHRLPLRLRVLHFVLQLQVQDLDRLLQGCVGSYIWGKRSLS